MMNSAAFRLVRLFVLKSEGPSIDPKCCSHHRNSPGFAQAGDTYYKVVIDVAHSFEVLLLPRRLP
jgi:hypothetical protein